MNTERITYLYLRYQAGTLTSKEEQEWELALADFSNDKTLLDLIDDSWYSTDSINHLPEGYYADNLYQYIVAQPQLNVPIKKTILRIRLWRSIAAAAVVTFMAIGIYFYLHLQQSKVSQELLAANDLPPGKTGATLTLSNGKTIQLTAAGTGELAKDAGVTLSKTADGQLVYELQNTGLGSQKTNTLTTGKGETYVVSLPDKSKIWLNAASSLTYTTSLIEKGARRVKLIGEAYFEIAKDQNHPFIVESDKQQVEVLGTHFNIESYTENPESRTTLLQGLIKISGKAGTKIMKPGQQAKLSNSSLNIREVDPEDAVAWKNGYFMFNIERLETVMQKVSRWYNVDVVFEDASLKDKTFLGSISKFEKVSKVLNMLERTGVAKFKIENRTIVITDQ